MYRRPGVQDHEHPGRVQACARPVAATAPPCSAPTSRGAAAALFGAGLALSAAGLILRALHFPRHGATLTRVAAKPAGNLGDVATLEAGTRELVLGRLA